MNILSELAPKEPDAERKGNSDQLAMIPEATSRETGKVLSKIFEETLKVQTRKCTNQAARQQESSEEENMVWKLASKERLMLRRVYCPIRMSDRRFEEARGI